MTAASHPPIERLSDLRDGLLEEDDARGVADHLAGCESCSAAVAALDDVAVVLTEEGRRPLQMPASVQRSIAAAVQRSAEEETVVSLHSRSAGTSFQRGRRRALPVLLGAAATVLALVVAGPVVSELLRGGIESDSAGGAAGSSRDEPEAAAGGAAKDDGAVQSRPPAAPRLDGSTVGDYAAGLAAGRVNSREPRRCAAADLPSASGGTVALVRYEGRRAALRVHPGARTVVVRACDEPGRVLHRSRY